jgi:hypothetical protein
MEKICYVDEVIYTTSLGISFPFKEQNRYVKLTIITRYCHIHHNVSFQLNKINEPQTKSIARADQLLFSPPLVCPSVLQDGPVDIRKD